MSLFNRGRENQELFPEVEKLKGDRHTDLEALKGKHWDIVIDTSGYLPKVVRFSTEILVDSVEHYIYISTTSVYKDPRQSKMDETSPIWDISDEEIASAEKKDVGDFPTGVSYGTSYGPLKAQCEREIHAVMADRTLMIRSGVVAGPHDYSYRFGYWINRISKGGKVLCPDQEETPVMYIDARDLADWVIYSVEQRITGIYNTRGDASIIFGQFLTACQTATQSDAELIWIKEAQLLGNGIQSWSDLPLWLPREFKGYLLTKDEKAIHHGLTFRSIGQTVGETFHWQKENTSPYRITTGFSAEREAKFLAKLVSE